MIRLGILRRGWKSVALLCVGWLAFSPSLIASSVEIHVKPTVDGKPLLLDSLRYENAVGEVFSITRLSLLLSEFSVQKDDGTWVRLNEGGNDAVTDDVVFLDAASKRTSSHLHTALTGKYRAMRFAVGPDKTTNHGDPAVYPAKHPLNPNFNHLHWDWKGGYLFMALEGLYRAGGDSKLKGYVFHLANDHNRTWINIPMRLDLSMPTRVDLSLDMASLLSAPRSVVFADTHSTHSREGDLLAEALRANLASAFHLKKISSATSAKGSSAAVKPKPLYLPGNPVGFPFKMSRRFPTPDLPADNPILISRVALGKKLFNDTTLSRDRTISCASCHQTEYGLTDAKRFSVGIDGQVGTRNSMPLFNLAWKKEFFWDGRASSLREQVLMPIADHTEMNLDIPSLVVRLKSSEDYKMTFAKAFEPGEITPETISLALENFLLTLTSYESKFDRAMAGQGKLSDQEKRGFELFMTEYEPRSRQYGADCFHCHGGALFSDHQFHNNGIKLNNEDYGRFQVTGRPSDKGKFSTPSLRNVASTSPYMHDGRFKTLEEVVQHYNAGLHRSETLDPNLAKHPKAGLGLSDEDVKALVAFLHTLSDEKYAATPQGGSK